MPGPVNRGIARSPSIAVRQAVGGGAAIDFPFKLFRNGEQGAWYDPSDLSTLYQDAAGTIPVTADGQPVGRMEDKSGNGNRATQTVAASRPVYQRGDSRGVVNLLSWSEDFSNSKWAKSGLSVNRTTNTNPFGASDSFTVTRNGAGGFEALVRTDAAGTGSVFFSVYAKPGNQDWVSATLISGGTDIRLRINMVAGTHEVAAAVGSYGGVVINPVNNGWYRIGFWINALATTTNVNIYPGRIGVAEAATVELWGAQLEQGTTATAYQRNDSHLGGVATGDADDLHWLFDDKVDDVMTAPLPAMPTATVARATDGGVTIDYPVNIPAGSYNIDNFSTHGFEYGRIIVDRQLTAPEQAALTAYLAGKS